MPRVVRSFMCIYCPKIYAGESECLLHERRAHAELYDMDNNQSINEDNANLLQTIATLLKYTPAGEKNASTIRAIQRLMDDSEENDDGEIVTKIEPDLDQSTASTTFGVGNGVGAIETARNTTPPPLAIDEGEEEYEEPLAFTADDFKSAAASSSSPAMSNGAFDSDAGTPPSKMRRMMAMTGPADGFGEWHCESCGKAFNNRNSLLRHSLIHTGERPYKCTMCERSFNQKVHLRRHQERIHVEELGLAEGETLIKPRAEKYSSISMVSNGAM